MTGGPFLLPVHGGPKDGRDPWLAPVRCHEVTDEGRRRTFKFLRFLIPSVKVS